MNPRFYPHFLNISNITFPVTSCLKHLSELHCGSDNYPELFYQLSQICHNIQLLSIEFLQVPDGLADLITVQQNLKYLYIIMQYDTYRQFVMCTYLTTDIINSLTKLPNTLIELDIYGEELQIPLSFISTLTRLQIMILSLENHNAFDDFVKLQYVTLSQLRVLKFQYP